ncbi:MAG TPA: transketolase family protein [Candidatus Marinimicrobia bacterium]|nr:transketolase family protein [Candidatus Neomarinimicrobiota bacterium]
MSILHRELSEKALMMPTRDAFGKGTIEAAKNNDIYVLTSDVAGSVRADWFAKVYPERFIELGIAEQNLVAVAAGMAISGKIAYASTFGVFLSGRVWDQVRVLAAYSQTNIKLVATHTGVTVGEDGATHQALEDIALMRVLPNMTVIVPADYTEAFQAVVAAAKIPGPVYIRLGRSSGPLIFSDEYEFVPGKAALVNNGHDLTIIACGMMVYEALLAARQLREKGISARVLNLSTIKPLDKEALLSAARETRAIITVEEHQIAGGMGSAVAEFLSQNESVPMEMMGIKDKFGISGNADALLDYYQLRAPYIVKAAEMVISRKR